MLENDFEAPDGEQHAPGIFSAQKDESTGAEVLRSSRETELMSASGKHARRGPVSNSPWPSRHAMARRQSCEQSFDGARFSCWETVHIILLCLTHSMPSCNAHYRVHDPFLCVQHPCSLRKTWTCCILSGQG